MIYKVSKSKEYTFVEIKTTSEIYFQKKCLRLRIFTHRRILRSRIRSNLHVGFHIRLAMWKTWRAKDKLCMWIGKSDLLNGSMTAMVCIKIYLIIYFYIFSIKLIYSKVSKRFLKLTQLNIQVCQLFKIFKIYSNSSNIQASWNQYN